MGDACIPENEVLLNFVSAKKIIFFWGPRQKYMKKDDPLAYEMGGQVGQKGFKT